MARCLLLAASVLFIGCYPPDTALDYLVHPLKDCNHDVKLENRSSKAVKLLVRVSDRISDTRCEVSSAESEVLVEPGKIQMAHAHIRCVDCYVSRSATVTGADGEKLHAIYEGETHISCDDHGCH